MDMQPLVLMSAKDLVTEKLREEIYTGNLKPGQELVQEKISEQLGVSRMPVREALLLLENAGLVEIQKNKRAIVRAVTPEEVREYVYGLCRDIGPTGYIVASGCDIPTNARPENVRAMCDAANSYLAEQDK